MIETASPALHQALVLLRAPRGPRPGPAERLPPGTLQLVRIAAGEDEATAEAEVATGQSPQALRDAAIFYIQQVFFAPGSNSYRILGVDPDVPDERLREHYRWLARWLHPDRNPDEWEVVFAERVNAAWQDLRTSERRARYQPASIEPDEWSAIVAAPPAHVFQSFSESPVEVAKPRDLRWIPSAVVAVLGSVAIGLIVLFYSSQRETPVSAVALESPPADERPARLAMPGAEPTAPALSESAPAPPKPSGSALPTRPDAPVPTLAAPPASNPGTLPTSPDVGPALSARSEPLGKGGRQSAAPVPVAVAESTPTPTSVEPPAVPPRRVDETVAASPAPVESEPPPPGSRDANRLLGQLSRAYEDGDIQGMRALFAADAQGPAGGLDSILAEYRRVFADSNERSLSVRDVSCFVTGDVFTIVASFEANVTSERPSRSRKTRGDLRLDLRREGDRWQIFRMQHGERPG